MYITRRIAGNPEYAVISLIADTKDRDQKLLLLVDRYPHEKALTEGIETLSGLDMDSDIYKLDFVKPAYSGKHAERIKKRAWRRVKKNGNIELHSNF